MLKSDRNLPEHGVKVVQSFKEAQWGMGPIVMSVAFRDAAWLDWHSICDLRSTDGRAQRRRHVRTGDFLGMSLLQQNLMGDALKSFALEKREESLE